MIHRNKRTPSNYNCVLCGRNTNDKKYFVDEWGNYFFACRNCKKVWCASCLGQLTGIGPRKAFKLGKKGKMVCVECNSFVPMIKLPINLPFTQDNIEQHHPEEFKFCNLCGHKISLNARYCESCGGEQ
ncbi:MAG: hypothetical protein JW891_08985 [Candidatus Lokiarchaeota archaeon]|nr:hypothetical protein [Candidatus Lokiarchaeota archaeon]